MSVRVQLEVEGLGDAAFAGLLAELGDRSDLHAEIATTTEEFLKAHGRAIAPSHHRTAQRLGARPTGHLEAAYEQIQAESDQSSASLLIPRASRLRAAFGPYVVQPGPDVKFLTLPAARDAYGKRAREFPDLFYARTPSGPVLARRGPGDEMEVMYLLQAQAEIPEDPTLIPFDELEAEAVSTTEGYLDDLVERHLT